MRSWFEYGEITSQELYNKLSKKEKDILKKFKDYIMISASEGRADESAREILRFKEVTNKPLDKYNLEDLRHFLKELKQSGFADHTKNKVKGYVQRFLRWNFKDWSQRFNEFEDIKYNSEAQNKKKIDKKVLLTEKDIEKLLEEEPSLYWKTFLITQYEGGLRTKETRELEWKNIDFEDDGFTTLKIPSKKNKHGTIKINEIVVKTSGKFLENLKKEQGKREIKTKWVFPSPQDPTKPISKSVNLWFNNLCKKVLGRPANNYLLRHSKGTQLQEKVRKGELSKDNAVEFMRHSQKMFDKVYSHMDKEDIKQLMKKQIYNTKELTKEKKHELELKLEQQQKIIDQLWKDKKSTGELIVKLANEFQGLKKKSKK